MNRFVTSGLLVAALALGTLGAEPPKVKIVPPDGTIAAQTLIKIELQSDAKNARFGRIISGITSGKDYFLDSNGRILYVNFPHGGTYTLTAVASANDEIGEDVLTLTVTGDGGGGGDDDSSKPDALTKALKAAYAAEPVEVSAPDKNGVNQIRKRDADVLNLRDAYRILAEKVNDAAMKTPKDIGELTLATRSEAVGTRLPKMRDVIGKDFATVINGAENKLLTDIDRVNASKAFSRYAAALDKLK